MKQEHGTFDDSDEENETEDIDLMDELEKAIQKLLKYDQEPNENIYGKDLVIIK